MRTLRLATLVAALSLVGLATGGSLATGSTNVLVNGDFETGSMSGWGHAPGHPLVVLHGWFAYHGTVAPISGAPVPPPPQGKTAALVDQAGPGGNVLFQTFRVPKNAQLSMTLWYVNYAGVFFTPRLSADISFLKRNCRNHPPEDFSSSFWPENTKLAQLTATFPHSFPGN